jgi:hypothetical protein
MGQYYNPAILGDNKRTVKAWIYSHDYDNGLNLMEHSWLLNRFVGAFESLIMQKPQRVVWAGDYADECKGLKSNVYGRCADKTKVNPVDTVIKREIFPYLVNHSKNQFIDKRKCVDVDGWIIHPLPLMTCEGNGRGGGDYHINHEAKKGNVELIGTWARDVISLEIEVPSYCKEEIIFDLFK